MEESTESSIKSSPSSSSSGSGWTLYFDEFIATEKEEQKEQKSSSMVSDAASHFPGKSLTEKSKKLSLKKRKAKEVSFFNDDPLEDTASSPVNSPKVGGMGNYLDINRGKKEDIRSSEKGIDGLGIVDGSSELTELKKKGLCLVPLSMLEDFLGH